MKILTGTQIKAADAYTIQHEPIESIALMERASQKIAEWINRHFSTSQKLFFLIGKGNNGGDGLAVARILNKQGFECRVFLAFDTLAFTPDTFHNFKKLPHTVKVASLADIDNDCIIIDALLGTGLKGITKEPLASIISTINALPNLKIAIDISSGMQCEFGNINADTILHADITLTLEFPKLAMLLPEVGECCGKIEILSIGLYEQYFEQVQTPYYLIHKKDIISLYKARKKFAYKNTYGHALLICGSQTMMGASLLAVSSALRSGCGLVTAHIPHNQHLAMQIKNPSALLSIDHADCFSTIPENIEEYSAVGIGCGLGQSMPTIHALERLLLQSKKPMVIDADALNIIAADKKKLSKIPKNSILTPHLGELKRLIGEWQNEEKKIKSVVQFATQYQLYIVVKGAYSMLVCPDENIYFNSTGNSGMAKGGSGDVLTGLITGLLARGYNSCSASIIGTYLHGLAGDIAAINLTTESMHSEDIITYLPQAFKTLDLDIF